jgi:hypothetical protein
MVSTLRSRPATTAKLITPSPSQPGASRNQQWNTTGSKARSSVAPTTTGLLSGPTASLTQNIGGLRLRRRGSSPTSGSKNLSTHSHEMS